MDSGKVLRKSKGDREKKKSENKILSHLKSWTDLPNELEIISFTNLGVADYKNSNSRFSTMPQHNGSFMCLEIARGYKYNTPFMFEDFWDLVVFDGRIFFLAGKYSYLQIWKFNWRSVHLEHFLLSSIVGDSTKNIRIDFSLKKCFRVYNLGDEALFIDHKSIRLSYSAKWGGRSNCTYYLPFNSKTYYVYSLNGRLLEDNQIVRCHVPAQINMWYFPDPTRQPYSIDKVRDDV
ncbi:hypothetical protein Patl1_29791 [Pistacia atlantica]|uniref:Uncharacterized protein n=1 Tax=Pistacia atlantica TaxID=434234 RepID=A0ACC1AC34_9ROSI|nr:hypothetical protein Patl1_29791 [Pistacia atlantica]